MEKLTTYSNEYNMVESRTEHTGLISPNLPSKSQTTEKGPEMAERKRQRKGSKRNPEGHVSRSMGSSAWKRMMLSPRVASFSRTKSNAAREPSEPSKAQRMRRPPWYLSLGLWVPGLLSEASELVGSFRSELWGSEGFASFFCDSPSGGLFASFSAAGVLFTSAMMEAPPSALLSLRFRGEVGGSLQTQIYSSGGAKTQVSHTFYGFRRSCPCLSADINLP